MEEVLLWIQLFWQWEYSFHVTATLSFALLYACYYAKFAKAHFLVKGTYDTKKKNIGRPPPPYPNGWYNVIRADELKPGDVRSIDIAGQNIVLYRGKDKQIYAL
jgi:cholesterol 7-dehydrogenase